MGSAMLKVQLLNDECAIMPAFWLELDTAMPRKLVGFTMDVDGDGVPATGRKTTSELGAGLATVSVSVLLGMGALALLAS